MLFYNRNLLAGYRETKPTTQAWEWTKLDAQGKKRPLATLGANDVELPKVVTVDCAALLALQPNQVAAAIAGAAR